MVFAAAACESKVQEMSVSNGCDSAIEFELFGESTASSVRPSADFFPVRSGPPAIASPGEIANRAIGTDVVSVVVGVGPLGGEFVEFWRVPIDDIPDGIIVVDGERCIALSGD